jgi:hypothetical protein
VRYIFSSYFGQKKGRLSAAKCKKILADDLPYLPLWFTDVVSVHRRSLGDLQLSPTGDFDFPFSLSRSADAPAAPHSN